jgi:DNA-binding CsgD family transcriptional regulator
LLLLRGECRLLAGEPAAAAGDLAELARHHDANPGHPDRVRALERLSLAHFLLGNWQDADTALDGLDPSGGDSAGPALRAMLAALRAPDPAPWPAAARPPGSAEPDRLTLATCAEAIALLAHRRHADVLAAIGRLTADPTGLADAPAKFAPLWLPVHAEAAIETASPVAAEAALAQLRDCAQHVPYLAVTLHRLAARAAEQRRDLTAAAAEYQAALLAAQSCPQLPPLHRAHLDHAYGRHLCTLGATTPGLAHLHRAQSILATLGAPTKPAAPPAATPLTTREAAVATLVASGLTNRQVAEELLITPKGVECHLGKIYRKLGIRTRGELSLRWPA